MSQLLERLLGRLPVGWLQLTHSRTRFAAAVAGVSFATLLVFMQLGIQGAMSTATLAPYDFLDGDIILSAEDANTLTDGSNVARARLFQALAVPGVERGSPLFVGILEFKLPDSTNSTLQAFATTVAERDFLSAEIASQFERLTQENTALIDTETRGVAPEVFAELKAGQPFAFEVNGQTLTAIGTLELGGGFSADGTLFVSDQTFLRFFGKRTSSAPNHILLKVADGVSPQVVVERLRAALPEASVQVNTLEAYKAADLAYQSLERPTGIIFGFGVIIGIIVGIVIVYQVLSTDVADHLKEYATFKAMGYEHRFFLGIVLEEAAILAVFGFFPGFVVSMGLYAALSAVTSLPVYMDVARVFMVFFGTLAACALSGAIATRRLAAADPADLF
ncbi:ABC transporter permease DevC [uncultured Lentibacter sp.]|uniref:ABC transporter permease DevC n=1 Tax=uncultured Lentibacter sp. TaxID=1659309 RepID=UPI002619F1FF|nr:ABC transporter permease DevC [uncultured Lentibacter sp.]